MSFARLFFKQISNIITIIQASLELPNGILRILLRVTKQFSFQTECLEQVIEFKE